MNFFLVSLKTNPNLIINYELAKRYRLMVRGPTSRESLQSAIRFQLRLQRFNWPSWSRATFWENMDEKPQDVSPAKAVLLGALAPGVNGPTWNTLKSAFLLLGLCLAVMLGLAFSSSDFLLILHVGFLVLITASLFFLLSWFLSQTGLVSVEHQMRELDLVPNDHRE